MENTIIKDNFLEIMFLQRMDIWERQISKLKAKVDKNKNKKEFTVLQAYMDPRVRAVLYIRMKNGLYHIGIPHEAQVPKDDGTMRIVYVYEMTIEQPDRLILSIINEILMEYCKSMIHSSCKSYQKGIGCGKVNQELVNKLIKISNESKSVEFACKLDLSKYFDSVLLKYILKSFDKAENIMGKSVIFDILRECYQNNKIIDLNKNEIEKYTSIRQGCAIGSWLADVVLYEVDKTISEMDVLYIRYSDDMIIAGHEYKRAFTVLENMLSEMGLKLNPKKVEILRKDKYFKFLGFSIRGNEISLSKSRLHSFMKEIQKRTVKKHLFSKNYKSALRSVLQFIYGGEYSWATSILPIINIEEDIKQMNAFVMDMLRACQTGKYNKKFGLGYESDKRIKGKGLRHGVVTYHPIGSAGTNRQLVPELDGWKSLGMMRKALLTSRQAYETLVRTM